MFLYIFENGTVTKSTIPPLQDDLASIRDGFLRVIEFRNGDVKEVNEYSKLTEVEDVYPDATNCRHDL